VDRDRLIAEVMHRTGVRLSPDDPAFALVELNLLAFDDLIQRAGDRLDPLAERIDKAARLASVELTRTALRSIGEETREARALIANEAREAAARVSAEADAARKVAAAAIETMIAAQRTGARWKMAIVGASTALLIAMCAFLAGYALGVAEGPRIQGPQVPST
jgi:hypothetical protein